MGTEGRARGLAWAGVRWAAPAIAGLLLALMPVGVRNAWDLVTWIAPGTPPEIGGPPPPG